MEKSEFNYLYIPPKSTIDPPIQTQKNTLPIEKLYWEDFERLCLTIVENEYGIDNCEIYGTKGEQQDGIDLYVKKDISIYNTYQCKRYNRITNSDLEKIIQEFKNGKWLHVTDEFYLCVSISMDKNTIQDKFNSLKNELFQEYGIKLKKFDKTQLSRYLKNNPNIVYRFFGKEWVKIFNGEDALKEISKTTKLDSKRVIEYRQKLYKFYQDLFNTYDPGLPSHEITSQIFSLQKRFIIPDVWVESRDNNDIFFEEDSKTYDLNYKYDKYVRENELLLTGKYNQLNDLKAKIKSQGEKNEEPTIKRESVDEILPNGNKNLILGEPGSGKSTLLRYIILDLLSPNPKLNNISMKWGNLLPIWLPFAFITKCLVDDSELSIQEILKKWFKSFDNKYLFDLVKDALDDSRLLLFIDGIDEWNNESSAHTALLKIEVLRKASDSIIVYTSRPYGFNLIRESLSDINKYNLATFSNEQKREFINIWLKKWLQNSNEHSYSEEVLTFETDQFLNELNKMTEIRNLSYNPLLLSILLIQKLRNSKLPRNRINALKDITEYLINKHPSKRKRQANIIQEKTIELDEFLEDIFSELALRIQLTNEGIISKKDARDVIENFCQIQ